MHGFVSCNANQRSNLSIRYTSTLLIRKTGQEIKFIHQYVIFYTNIAPKLYVGYLSKFIELGDKGD